MALTWQILRNGDRHDARDAETGALRAWVWRLTDERWLAARVGALGDRPLGRGRTAEAARALVDQQLG
jgi:hypothetical protein